MNTSIQIYEFMGCIYAGIIMGIVYMLLGVFRFCFRNKHCAIAILDGIYWLICFVIACVALYVLTSGRVALFHLLGFALGGIVCVQTLRALA